MSILRNLNFWDHLKNSIGIDVVKNNVKIAAEETESEEDLSSKTIIQILKEVEMDNDFDLLGSNFSNILLSPKVFKPEIQKQIESEIDTKKEELRNKIVKSNVIKNIDKLINDLEECNILLDKASSAAAIVGKKALTKEPENFVRDETKKTEVDDEDGGFES